MPAPHNLRYILEQVGDGGTVAIAERVAAMIEQAKGGAGPSRAGAPAEAAPLLQSKDCSADPSPTPTPTVSFRTDTVEELIGQLVGAASSTRLWDQLPPNYPYGAGVFQENAAGALVDAAVAEYARITGAAATETVALPAAHRAPCEDGSVCGEPHCPPAESSQDIDWDDDPDGEDRGEPTAPAATEPARADGTTSAADIRAWARDNNIDVPAKGFIPKSVREQYYAANPEA